MRTALFWMCTPSIFDRFHVQRMAHDAVDEARREAVRCAGRGKAGGYLKNMRWPLQKNPWSLTVSQKEKMSTLERKNRLLYRAYLLKEKLAEIMDGRQWRLACQRLDAWIDWARKSKPTFRETRRENLEALRRRPQLRQDSAHQRAC